MNMNSRDLARYIKSRADYHGENVRLIACSTGKIENNETCFAENLANALNVTVKAPNELLFMNNQGKIKIGVDGKGEFIEYTPNQRRRLK